MTKTWRSCSVICFTEGVFEAYHVSDGSPWKDDSADELADDVETAWLICDGHDDADWYEEEGGDGKGEQ